MRDSNLFFAGLAILLEVTFVGGIVAFFDKVLPGVKPWKKRAAAGVVLAAPLMLFAFPMPSVSTIWQHLTHWLPALGLWLWAMLVLMYGLQAKASRKRIEEVHAASTNRIDDLQNTVTELTRLTRDGLAQASKAAGLEAEQVRLRVENRLLDKVDELRKQIAENKAVEDARYDSIQRAFDDLLKQLEEEKSRSRDEKERAHQAWLDEEIPCSGRCDGTKLKRRDFLKLPDWASFAHIAGRNVEHVCPKCLVAFSSPADLMNAKKAFT